MAPNEIAERRLFYQQMIATALQSPAELVAWFGAMQAQEYALSKWSLGLRLRHLTEASVEKSFADGHLLRIHLLRPTWHFVAAQDIRWLLRLTAPRVHAANAFMYRKLGLDAALFRRCNGLLADMLRGGRYLTRNAVNEVFRKHGIEAEGNRLAYIMMQAELDGLICSGPRKGKQLTYALLDERVPAGQDLGRDEAMSKLALRYFSSRGPATIKDFSAWSGLTIADCRTGANLAGDALSQEKIAGEVYFFPVHLPAMRAPEPEAHLLPVYDEYIMGYKDRSAILQRIGHTQPELKLPFFNTIVYDGQVIGSWKRVERPKSIGLEYDFLLQPGPEQLNAFEMAAQRFGAFHGVSAHY
ncbi:MAG: AlkZ family DNA glycosylase [Phaeodactylibacter sp.]|nr:AlkZ family DNA glycosylase [Phaeodactylibacter sp.]MCB9273586.1 AlkZ family DNA glycosylase [Lewinellaceae bacterium]